MTNTTTPRRSRGTYKVDPRSATSIRNLRNRIKHTVNILALDGMRVTELPGEAWLAEMENRRVRWTNKFPLPPHQDLDDESILYLCAHEISHINWSGLIDWDLLGKKHKDAAQISDRTKGQFHRFVNAVEDIRVDRLSSLKYGGFRGPKVHLDKKVRDWHINHGEIEGWSLVDACAIMWIYACDIELPLYGSDRQNAITASTWPFINRVANLHSTQAVAEAIWPLFVKLDELDKAQPKPPVQQPQGQPQQGSGPAMPGEGEPGEGDPSDGEAGEAGDGAGMPGGGGGTPGEEKPADPDEQDAKEAADATDPNEGADEPTDMPTKSDGDPDTAPLGKGEEFEGMAQDAKTPRAKMALKDAATKVNEQKRNAKQVVKMDAHASDDTGGSNAGSGGSGFNQSGENAWVRTYEQVRGPSNALANRLRAVLRHNAAENWAGGHRRGRLHTSKAYRAAAGNTRIFRKREQLGALDYAFGILIDTSGSMNEDGGAKGEAAFKAAVLVAEAINKAGLDLMMLTWESRPKRLKRFRDTLQARRSQIGRELYHPAGGTYEAPSLIAAIEEFRSCQSKHRMLFQITDGDTRGKDESKALIEELRDIGVISVAIGVNFEPADHYDIRLEVQNPEELSQVLPRFINSYVKKGAR